MELTWPYMRQLSTGCIGFSNACQSQTENNAACTLVHYTSHVYMMTKITYLNTSLFQGFFSHPFPVAALHQGEPGQTTWLEDPPPRLLPAYCFALLLLLAQYFILNSRLGQQILSSIDLFLHGLSDHLMILLCSTAGFVCMVC